jgi:hypothetical protein
VFAESSPNGEVVGIDAALRLGPKVPAEPTVGDRLTAQ